MSKEIPEPQIYQFIFVTRKGSKTGKLKEALTIALRKVGIECILGIYARNNNRYEDYKYPKTIVMKHSKC
jgi:hypothetical protein